MTPEAKTNTGSLCERCGEMAPMPGDYWCADCEADVLNIARRLLDRGKAHPLVLREEDK